MRLLNLIGRIPVIVAPRGEFSPGHLALKAFKYIPYIYFSKAALLYCNVIWQASSDYEKNDIVKWFGDNAIIKVAPNLPTKSIPDIKKNDSYKKRSGQLRIVFLSRISRKKNLDGALQMLQGLDGDITFTICGPIGDQDYWNECNAFIKKLPDNIRVIYRGTIHHSNVFDEMGKHDLFFLPTHGENYGHVIMEALSAGCPVLISDQTPWRDLETKGVGWDIALDDVDKFREVLQKCIKMDGRKYFEWSKKATMFSQEQMKNNDVIEMNRNLFLRKQQGHI